MPPRARRLPTTPPRAGTPDDGIDFALRQSIAALRGQNAGTAGQRTTNAFGYNQLNTPRTLQVPIPQEAALNRARSSES